jgi:hypothetical protein
LFTDRRNSHKRSECVEWITKSIASRASTCESGRRTGAMMLSAFRWFSSVCALPIQFVGTYVGPTGGREGGKAKRQYPTTDGRIFRQTDERATCAPPREELHRTLELTPPLSVVSSRCRRLLLFVWKRKKQKNERLSPFLSLSETVSSAAAAASATTFLQSVSRRKLTA